MSLDSQVAIAPLRIQFLCHPKGDARVCANKVICVISMFIILLKLADIVGHPLSGCAGLPPIQGGE